MLTACGGDGTGPSAAVPLPDEIPAAPIVTQVVSVAPLGAPVVDFSTGSAVPVQVNMFGVDTPVSVAIADRPIYTDGRFDYMVATGPREGFAMAGFSPQSSGLVGSYVNAVGAVQTGGSASYQGTYSGVLIGPMGGSHDDIRGDLTLNANFDAGTVDGSILQRGATTVAGYNMSAIVSDVSFSGAISSDTGKFSAQHADWNSLGVLEGVAYSENALGVLNLRHVDAAGVGVDVFEVSAFALN